MKIIRVLLGPVAGALITAVFTAFQFWVVFYTDPSTGFLGAMKDLAPLAAIVGGICGLIAGAVLGLFLTLLQRGPVFGAVSGAIFGFAVALLIVALEGMPEWSIRGAGFIAAFVPIGAVSGLLTSLVVPVIASWANSRDDRYVELNLQTKRS